MRYVTIVVIAMLINGCTAPEAAKTPQTTLQFEPAQTFSVPFMLALPPPTNRDFSISEVRATSSSTFIVTRWKKGQTDRARQAIVSGCTSAKKGRVVQAEELILPSGDLGLFVECKL